MIVCMYVNVFTPVWKNSLLPSRIIIAECTSSFTHEAKLLEVVTKSNLCTWVAIYSTYPIRKNKLLKMHDRQSQIV